MPDSPLCLPEQSGAEYAGRLLSSLQFQTSPTHSPSRDDAAIAWARSGAMWLTGDQQPLTVSAPLALATQGAFLALQTLAPKLRDFLGEDFPAEALLGERAAIAGYQRQGSTSCGGSCRLLQTADGVIALNLARDDDWELLPALLSACPPPADIPAGDWATLIDNLKLQRTDHLLALGKELGLGLANADNKPAAEHWYQLTETSQSERRNSSPLVVDLSSLWAGPLCGSLLAASGARVIKVESQSRPDGARLGPAAFFDLMNSRKQSLALDFKSEIGVKSLHKLLEQADIVIEGTRPRALQQLGIHAEQLLARKAGQIWVSITGYGRSPACAQRIAYGDDAGVAAGLSRLLYEQHGQYAICGDAIADPITGLHAALAASALWRQGHGGLLDINLCDVVRHASHPRCDMSAWQVTGDAGQWWIHKGTQRQPIAAPRARQSRGQAPALGADNAVLIEEFKLSC